MNLDFFNDLKNNLKNNENINNFLEELLNYLKKDNNLGIIEKIKNENNVSEISENKMLNEQNSILKNYADKTKNNGALYFISGKAGNKYIIFKYKKNKESTININQNQLPSGFKINDILRQKEGKLIIDNKATEIIKKEIEQMANKVVEEQNLKLENFRKENHLYQVEEDRNNRIYLKDITLKIGNVLEEVDFPKELLSKAVEGTIFKYINGEYKVFN